MALAQEKYSRIFFAGIILLTLFGSYQLLAPYIPMIVISFVIAVIYSPVYEFLKRVMFGNSSLATTGTLLAIFLTAVIPLVFLVSVIVTQAIAFSDDINAIINNNNEDISLDSVVADINNVLADFEFIDYQIESADVVRGVREVIQPLGQIAFDNALILSTSALGLVSEIVVFIMVISAFLNRRQDLLNFIKRLSPLDNKIDDLYIQRLTDMAVAMVKGTFLISIINAALTAFFLWLGGVEYTGFWFLIAFFASLIPLGAGIVSWPIGMILIATGNVWQGLLQITSYLLIVSNVDNVLRPRLVPKTTTLHPALTVLSIFGGIKLFGFLGIVFGPVLLIFVVTTLQVYLEHFRQDQS